AGWFTRYSPRDFGFFRSRWTCATATVLLWFCFRLTVSRETVRRWLRREDLVWRRPRPVLRRRDPLRGAKLLDLRLLLARLPPDRVIHVICDNARFHQAARCKRLQEYLGRWGHRIRLHYLPTYAPETNPIERVWWHLHDEVTRNHQCQTMQELSDLVFRWL